jgi:hypothetical protein
MRKEVGAGHARELSTLIAGMARSYNKLQTVTGIPVTELPGFEN